MARNTFRLRQLAPLILGFVLFDRFLKATVGKRPFRHATTVLITGGSRGLGFALALEYARRGAHILLCSPESDELAVARHKLAATGAHVTTFLCDVTRPEQVRSVISEVDRRFGAIDVLINNAGIMEVGPVESFETEDFEKIAGINLFGLIRMTLEALPLMGPGARIVNIASIGGAVAVPHMITYSVSKFGVVGFSLGLDAELSRRGISVTTVLPGLMRTGSFGQAYFRGNRQAEYDWFALGAATPGISVPAQSAASEIAWAAQKRKRFAVIGPQAKVLRIFCELFPELALSLMRGVDRLLPTMPEGSENSAPIQGRELNLPVPDLGSDEREAFNQKVG